MKLFQSSIFRAICAIIVGLLLIKFPKDGVTWLTMAIGVLFLISGIIAMIAYLQTADQCRSRQLLRYFGEENDHPSPSLVPGVSFLD